MFWPSMRAMREASADRESGTSVERIWHQAALQQRGRLHHLESPAAASVLCALDRGRALSAGRASRPPGAGSGSCRTCSSGREPRAGPGSDDPFQHAHPMEGLAVPHAIAAHRMDSSLRTATRRRALRARGLRLISSSLGRKRFTSRRWRRGLGTVLGWARRIEPLGAAVAQKMLHHPVFAGMKADDREARRRVP